MTPIEHVNQISILALAIINAVGAVVLACITQYTRVKAEEAAANHADNVARIGSLAVAGRQTAGIANAAAAKADDAHQLSVANSAVLASVAPVTEKRDG